MKKKIKYILMFVAIFLVGANRAYGVMEHLGKNCCSSGAGDCDDTAATCLEIMQSMSGFDETGITGYDNTSYFPLCTYQVVMDAMNIDDGVYYLGIYIDKNGDYYVQKTYDKLKRQKLEKGKNISKPAYESLKKGQCPLYATIVVGTATSDSCFDNSSGVRNDESACEHVIFKNNANSFFESSSDYNNSLLISNAKYIIPIKKAGEDNRCNAFSSKVELGPKNVCTYKNAKGESVTIYNGEIEQEGGHGIGGPITKRAEKWQIVRYYSNVTEENLELFFKIDELNYYYDIEQHDIVSTKWFETKLSLTEFQIAKTTKVIISIENGIDYVESCPKYVYLDYSPVNNIDWVIVEGEEFNVSIESAEDEEDISPTDHDGFVEIFERHYCEPIEPEETPKEETSTTCEGILSPRILEYINEILDLLRIAIPLLLSGLITRDFITAFASGTEETVNKAKGRAIKRVIIAIVIFFVPTILNFIFNIINEVWGTEFSDCITKIE